MKLNELIDDLRRPYSLKRGYGVSKLDSAEKEWQNIYFVIPKAPPRKLDLKVRHNLLSEALKVVGALPQVNEMSELDELINYLFVRREVVQSSRLEGTWSTIDHALTPRLLAEENEGKSEHLAVRGYANLLEGIVEEAINKKEKIFTQKFICNIHKKIVENDPKSQGVAGRLRTEGKPGAIVTIGGGLRKENSIYNPTPASHVKESLNQVIKWLKDSELAQLGDAGVGCLSLPVRIAIGHVHFEAVHPFTDGNGRTGRTLWPIQMVCSGYMPLYLSGYVEAYKDEYAKALEVAQKKLNYNPIVEFICNAIIESDLENQKTKKAIEELSSAWEKRGGFRANSAPKKALKVLLTKPIVSTALLQAELGISKTASVDAIKALVKKKIIRHRRTENRARIYAAEELIELLSRPFGEDIGIAFEKAQGLLNITKSV